MQKIKDFLLNHAAGKVMARAAVALAAYMASGQMGASVNVDPAELQMLFQALFQGAYSLYKKWTAPKA